MEENKDIDKKRFNWTGWRC